MAVNLQGVHARHEARHQRHAPDRRRCDPELVVDRRHERVGMPTSVYSAHEGGRHLVHQVRRGRVRRAGHPGQRHLPGLHRDRDVRRQGRGRAVPAHGRRARRSSAPVSPRRSRSSRRSSRPTGPASSPAPSSRSTAAQPPPCAERTSHPYRPADGGGATMERRRWPVGAWCDPIPAKASRGSSCRTVVGCGARMPTGASACPPTATPSSWCARPSSAATSGMHRPATPRSSSSSISNRSRNRSPSHTSPTSTSPRITSTRALTRPPGSRTSPRPRSSPRCSTSSAVATTSHSSRRPVTSPTSA